MIDPDQIREVGIHVAGALREIASALGNLAVAVVIAAFVRGCMNK